MVILGISVASQMFFIVGSAYLGLQAIVGFMYVGGALAFFASHHYLVDILLPGDVRTEKDIDRIKLREERPKVLIRSFEDLTAWNLLLSALFAPGLHFHAHCCRHIL